MNYSLGALQAATVILMALLLLFTIKALRNVPSGAVPISGESWQLRAEPLGEINLDHRVRGGDIQATLPPGRYYVGNRGSNDILLYAGPSPFRAIFTLRGNGTASFTLLKGSITYFGKKIFPDDKCEITINGNQEIVVNDFVGLELNFERGDL